MKKLIPSLIAFAAILSLLVAARQPIACYVKLQTTRFELISSTMRVATSIDATPTWIKPAIAMRTPLAPAECEQLFSSSFQRMYVIKFMADKNWAAVMMAGEMVNTEAGDPLALYQAIAHEKGTTHTTNWVDHGFDLELLIKLGKESRRLGRFLESRRWLARAAVAAPASGKVLLETGRTERYLDLRSALDAYERSIAIDGESRAASGELAHIQYLLLGSLGSASGQSLDAVEARLLASLELPESGAEELRTSDLYAIAAGISKLKPQSASEVQRRKLYVEKARLANDFRTFSAAALVDLER